MPKNGLLIAVNPIKNGLQMAANYTELPRMETQMLMSPVSEALQTSKPDEYLAYDGSTALVMAARTGHGGAVKILLDSRASPAVRTEDGSTILSHAVSGGLRWAKSQHSFHRIASESYQRDSNH